MSKRNKIVAGVAAVAVAAGGTGVALAGGSSDDDGDRGDSEAPITGSALEQAKAAALESTGEGQVTETEVGDEESYYEVEVTRDDGRQVDVQLDQNFNVVATEDEVGAEDEAQGEDEGAAEESSGDSDTPITGPDIERASAAALAHLGGGRVTDTEVGDEESYYEVEVTLDDGRQVDVQLDENFNVVGTEEDGVEDEESAGD